MEQKKNTNISKPIVAIRKMRDTPLSRVLQIPDYNSINEQYCNTAYSASVTFSLDGYLLDTGRFHTFRVHVFTALTLNFYIDLCGGEIGSVHSMVATSAALTVLCWSDVIPSSHLVVCYGFEPRIPAFRI